MKSNRGIFCMSAAVPVFTAFNTLLCMGLRRMFVVCFRPAWDKDTTADELAKRERDSYLEWRRELSV